MRARTVQVACTMALLVGACAETVPTSMEDADVPMAGEAGAPAASSAAGTRSVTLGVMAAGSGASISTQPLGAAAGGPAGPTSGASTQNNTGGTGMAAAAGRDSAAAGGAGASAQGVAGAAVAGSGGSVAAAGSGGAPAAGGGAPEPASSTINVWIAGDSTVANGNTPCPVGWGADFQAHFGANAKVENSAVGGRSVRTWLYNVQTQMDSSGECELAKDGSGNPTVQARWQRMLDGMHKGDYLLIQFGINDSSPTCDRHVGLEAFKASFGVMAQAAKQRGAQPVFLTPVSALSCKGSSAQGTRGGYVTATLDAGRQFDVPVIDLHARSVELYNSLGLCPIAGGGDVSASTGGKAGAFFCEDHTHFDRDGSKQIGDLIVKALRDQNIGLAERLRP